MKIITKISEMQQQSRIWKLSGQTVGVVPTMGALHIAHGELIKTCVQKCDQTVVTIFVNPTQFGPNEDFSNYPRTFEDDSKLCEELGASVIFHPKTNEMYSNSFSTAVFENDLSEGLCGHSRPGHFEGVTTIVAKLFNAVLPDIAVFGQKDFQQVQVIKKMTADLNFPVNIIGAPLVRHEDGLAVSSRNQYLTKEQRQSALSLSRGLLKVSAAALDGLTEAEGLKDIVQNEIIEAGGEIDYIEIVDSLTLKNLSGNLSGKKAVMAIAVFFDKTRLLDNILLKISEK